MQYGVILAGGSGTRLWPLSRAVRPKQLLPIVGGKSLLQVSFDRMRGLLPPEQIYVCTAEKHRTAIEENLPELPKDNIIGEPAARDTANAIGLSCELLLSRDPDAVCAIATADHVIDPEPVFHDAFRTAFEVIAEKPDTLVTFGITPTHGHTGLGYIHRGVALQVQQAARAAFKVLAFKEKPDRATADHYVDSGRYYWNSGMFVWRCDQVMKELEKSLPTNVQSIRKIVDAWDTPQRETTLNQLYENLVKISIDYAVLENASSGKGAAAPESNVVVVEMPVQWLDIGSWPALSETLKTDDHGNAISAETVVLVDSDSNIIVSSDPEHLISTIGLSDMIVVHTKDATMVCPKSEAQKVKTLVDKVTSRFGDKYK